MGRTRLEWTVADLAILSAGAVTVPVYETSTAEQCGYVLASCGARLAFADSASCRARLEEGWAGGGVVVAMEDGGLEAFGAGAGDDDMAVVDDRLPGMRQPWWFGYGARSAAQVDGYLRFAHGRSLADRLAGIPGALRLMLRPERPL